MNIVVRVNQFQSNQTVDTQVQEDVVSLNGQESPIDEQVYDYQQKPLKLMKLPEFSNYQPKLQNQQKTKNLEFLQRLLKQQTTYTHQADTPLSLKDKVQQLKSRRVNHNELYRNVHKSIDFFKTRTSLTRPITKQVNRSLDKDYFAPISIETITCQKQIKQTFPRQQVIKSQHQVTRVFKIPSVIEKIQPPKFIKIGHSYQRRLPLLMKPIEQTVYRFNCLRVSQRFNKKF